MLSIFCALFFSFQSMASDDAAKDPILLEMTRELAETKSLLEEEKKKFSEEYERDFKNATPQTGKNKFARKRWEESLSRQRKLSQLVLYHEVRISRRKALSAELEKIHKGSGKQWPDPEEIKEYQAERALRMKSKHWSVAERQKKMGVFQKKKAPPAQQAGGH